MTGRRILTVPIFLLVSALVFLSIGPGSGVNATKYDTTYQLTLTSYVPGAVTDVITTYQVGAAASVRNINFGSIYSATGYPEANIALDSEIDDGSSIGQAVNIATLSIFNGPCTAPITVTVPFSECTTDTLKTAPWVLTGDNLVQDNDGDMNEDGTSASPGTGNCIDGIDNDADGDRDGYDFDGSTVIEDPECNNETTDTNGIPTYCDHYPVFLNDMFNDVRPRARYMGHQVVVTDAPATMLDFVIFNPDALAGQPGVTGLLRDTYGYLDFVVLDNPIAPASPSTITDFCIPLTSQPTLLGTTDGSYTVTPGPEPYEVSRTGECGDANDNDADGWVNDGCLVHNAGVGAGQVRSTNPAAGTGLYGTNTHVVRTLSISQRDLDGDGISNNLDSCPFLIDTYVNSLACDPCVTMGDCDGDGLNEVCDPDDCTPSSGGLLACGGTSGLPDQDQDCFPNRQDICPLLRNGDPYDPVTSGLDQLDRDTVPGGAAADLGPNLDGIADACDNGTIPTIATPETNCNDNVDDDADTLADDGCTTSATFPNGHFHVAMPHTYVCIDPAGAAADTDGDGMCDATETLLGSLPGVAASLPEYIGLDLAIATGTPAQAPGTCSDFTIYNHPSTPVNGYDNDGDDPGDGSETNATDAGCGVIGDDPDQDGVCTGVKAGACALGYDNCPNDQNQEQVDRDGDTKGDACDPNDDGNSTTDHDTIDDRHETCMGTDPKDAVADSTKDNANPFDFDNNNVVDVTDAGMFLGRFPSAVTNPGEARYDYTCDNPDNVVDVTDAGIFLGKFPSAIP